MTYSEGLGDIDLSQLKQGKIKVAGISIDTKSPAAHKKERFAAGIKMRDAAIAGDNTAWANLWQGSGRDLPVRAVDAVAEGSSTRVGSPGIKPEFTAMLREVEAARGVPTPGNTTPGQPSSAYPTYKPPGSTAADSSAYPQGTPPKKSGLFGLDNNQLLMVAGIGLFLFQELSGSGGGLRQRPRRRRR